MLTFIKSHESSYWYENKVKNLFLTVYYWSLTIEIYTHSIKSTNKTKTEINKTNTTVQ